MSPRLHVPASWMGAITVTLAAVAYAQAPPPDPAQGERPDGRIESADSRQRALVAPRILLAPLRFLIKALSYPTRSVMWLMVRYHISEWLYAATTTSDGLRGVRPEVAWNLSFAFAGGLDYFDHRTLGPGTSLDARLIVGGANILETGLALRPTPSRWPAQARLSVEYVQRNDQYFNGIGGVQQGSRYSIAALSGSAGTLWRPARILRISAAAQGARKRFGEGDRRTGDPSIGEVYCVRVIGRCVDDEVDPRQVPGFDRGTQFMRGMVDVTLDLRDNAFEPRSGFAFNLAADYTHGLGFDRSSYFRVTGTATFAVSVWQRSHTFLLRGTAGLVEPINGVPVPFSELLVTGGPDSMRGFRAGAFRDSSLLVLSAEYRWPVWMFADASLFVDYGGTFAQSFRDLDANRLRWDVGTALRITTRSQFFLRLGLAYGFSGGGLQLIISGAGG